MFRCLRPFSLLAIACSVVSIHAAVAAPQCSTTVQGNAVAGAWTYELYSSTARNCMQPCVGNESLFIEPDSMRLVHTSSQPTFTVDSAPAFNGVWRVVARNSSGTELSVQNVGPVGPHEAFGRPFHGTGSTPVQACLGEEITLALRIVPANAYFQWYRDGFPISGATQSSLGFQVDASQVGALYTCIMANACGSSTAGPFLISASAGAPDGLVDWRSCKESEHMNRDGGYWWCGEYSTTTTRQGSCNALFTALGANSLTFTPSGSGSGSKSMTVSFQLAAPATLNFTSSSTPTGCFGTVNDRASAVLSGPVQVNLKPGLYGGSGSVPLPPGLYTLQAGISSGALHSCNWGYCSGCGPTCLSTCWNCNAWGSLNLGLSLTPITFDVPGVYPTIQAAIDAVPAGTARTITVAPGTYNQAFALNGKNVVVQGSAFGPTVLDGTGLTTSIAAFTGGEPATAGVENLVFRNGSAGQAINPPWYDFTGGGALFGRDSAAFVRNCDFEQCRADFGAAVYMLRCTLDIDGCTFTSNHATSDGGGMQAYASSGAVRNSTFTDNRCAVTYAGSGSAFKAVGIRTAGTSVTLENCTVSGNPVPGAGAAVEYFENAKILAGTLRLVGTDIVSNLSGGGTTNGAAGLRVIGSRDACVLSGGASVCGNTPRNVEGPFLAEGKWTVCDCLADLTEDGTVNAADLGIVLASWGTIDAQGSGDANHDGLVNGADLSTVLDNWGACD